MVHELIEQYRSGSSWKEQSATLVSLVNLGDPIADEFVVDAICNPDDTAVTVEGASALLRRGDKAGLRAVARALHHADDEASQYVYDAICAELGDEVLSRYAPVLDGSADLDARKGAAEAIYGDRVEGHAMLRERANSAEPAELREFIANLIEASGPANRFWPALGSMRDSAIDAMTAARNSVVRRIDAFLPSVAQRIVYISVPVAVVLTIACALFAPKHGLLEVFFASSGAVLSIVVLTFLAFDGIFFVRRFAGTPRSIYAAALLGDFIAFVMWLGVALALDPMDPLPWVVLVEVAVILTLGTALVLRIRHLDRRDRTALDQWLHGRDGGHFQSDETLADLFGIERFHTAPVPIDDSVIHVGAGGFRYHLFLDQRGVLDQWVGKSRGAFLWLRLETMQTPLKYVSARSRSGQRGALVVRPRAHTESRFESIDVDERLRIEHAPDADPIVVARIFDPVVLDTLATRDGVQIEVFDDTLVAYRMGPLDRIEQVNELWEVARAMASSYKRVMSGEGEVIGRGNLRR